MNVKSEVKKVANALMKNTRTPGITVSRLADRARVPKQNVYKRIHDLREVYGIPVYSNYRTYKGRRKMYYRANVA